MVRIVAAQLRHRVGRSLALLVGIVAAVTSFTVLTGTTEVSRLEVVGALEENFRGAYDILVRPHGSTTELESQRDLVRNNFLSGLYGGISLDQYETVKDVAGVEVAAPIAMLGYQGQRATADVVLTPYVDPAQPRQVFRIRTSLVTDRGLSTIPGEVRYAYVEQRGNDQPLAVCPETPFPETSLDRDTASFQCFSPDGQRPSQVGPEQPAAEGYVATMGWPVAYVLAAIDPEQEARLARLDEAVVEGRYLRPSDGPVDTPRPSIDVPMLVASDLPIDEHLEVTVERLPPQAGAEMLAGRDGAALQARLDRLAGEVVDRSSQHTSEAHQRSVTEHTEEFEGDTLGAGIVPVPDRWSVGPVDYDQTGTDRLRPRPVDVPDDRWSVDEEPPLGAFSGLHAPWSVEDTAYRMPQLHFLEQAPPRSSGAIPVLAIDYVGRFDPALLPAWSELSAVPMETYSPPGAVGWDDRSRDLLGGESLQPSSSPTGYIASPPLMLTTLSSLEVLANPDYISDVDAERPISAIRVRVAGVTGPDAESRERIRVVAEDIAERTGLDVDVTIGSSPTPMRVDLTAGRFGRPELSLREEWVRKGVAVAILDALDRKSALLFGLILVVCSLSLANAAAAAVRARRTELGVLACLGWSPRALYGAILGELLVIGLVAGALAAALTPFVARAFAIDVPASRALTAVAAALLLALLAGLWPAQRAARSEPAAAVRPAALAVRGTTQPRRVPGLAVTNLLRVPGRTALGALSLAVGVGALTLVLAATFGFRDVLVGSLLGEAISVKIRGVDIVAVIAVLLLGGFAVGDVLYLNVRDRAAELATLAATGWSTRHLALLVVWEGLLVGLLGSLVGAATGLVAAAVFAGQVPVGLWTTAGVAVLAGAGLAAAAAAIPARLSARLPIASLLAEE